MVHQPNAVDGGAGADDIGALIHGFIRDLFPLCRSITGEGVRETLRRVKARLPDLDIVEVASGTPAFDWTVPREWNIRGARLIGPDGGTVVDFQDSNLHVVSYSTPVDVELSLDELQSHLHSLPERPDAVPYVTSYYREHWGFCLPHRRREQLKPGVYRAVIDSTLTDGHLTFGELVIPGRTEQEVLISCNICHPSMASNELSGPAMAVFLAEWLSRLPERRLTYRFLFIPETIGSIVYLSRNLEHLQRRVVAGLVLSCIGDDGPFSHVPTKWGNALIDRIITHVLHHHADPAGVIRHTFRSRGSDERQYNSAGVDLPVAAFTRSLWNTFPQYHTSDDDLSYVTPAALADSLAMCRRILQAIEADRVWRSVWPCEPQLGKYGLYPTTGTRGAAKADPTVMIRRDILSYSDGRHSLLEIAETIGEDILVCAAVADQLAEAGLLRDVAPSPDTASISP